MHAERIHLGGQTNRLFRGSTGVGQDRAGLRSRDQASVRLVTAVDKALANGPVRRVREGEAGEDHHGKAEFRRCSLDDLVDLGLARRVVVQRSVRLEIVHIDAVFHCDPLERSGLVEDGCHQVVTLHRDAGAAEVLAIRIGGVGSDPDTPGPGGHEDPGHRLAVACVSATSHARGGHERQEGVVDLGG